MDVRSVLITGAAGNLGSRLARHLLARQVRLKLMYHRTPLPPDLAGAASVTGVRADLADPQTLPLAVEGVDALVPIVLRLGAVYGSGILMVEAARWLARQRLLAVWPEPTLYQLLSADDFLTAVEAAIFKPGIHGIYHVGDEQPVTLQEFLDQACHLWGYPRPRRLPFWFIYLSAGLCELGATIARTKSPLTRDFVRLGRVPHWGDTRRARAELIPELRYPTLARGLETLRLKAQV